MIRRTVGWSLRFRRIVIAAAVGVMAFGIVQLDETPTGGLPEFGPTTVEVQTEALGLAAAEVEQLITVPLEQDLLAGVAYLDDIESVSLPGLSSVVMTFEPGTDVLDARQLVQERLTQAVGVAGLPAVAKTPQMIQPLSSTSRVSMVKVTAEELTPIQMSVLARWVIGPRLLGVPGVANVAIWGNRERQLQVLVDPDRLQREGVTLDEVVHTTGNALEVSPLSYLEASTPGTGGFIDTPNQRLNIFHEQAISSPRELAEVPLERRGGAGPAGGSGGPTALGDVTEIRVDHQPLIGDAACSGGGSCLLMVVEKFPDANTTEVSEGVHDALDALAPGLADMRLDASAYEPAADIEDAVSEVAVGAIAGGLLLLLVLAGVLWSWRRVLIVTAGVTVSMATVLAILLLRDTTVNALVIAGLVVALTALIDDAVNDVDALSSGIRRHRDTTPERPWLATVRDRAAASRTSLLLATLVTAAVALPLFFLGGPEGAFLPPVAVSYLLAVGASMVVGLTLTPVLSELLLTRAPEKRSESPVVGWVRRRHEVIAPRLVSRTGVAVILLVGVAAAGIVATSQLSTSFSPSLQERSLVVSVASEPGTSLTRMTDLSARIVEDLGALPEVRDVNAQIGRAVMSDQVVDVSSGEVWVTLDPGADRDTAVDSIEDVMGGYADITSEVSTYSDNQVRETLQAEEHDVAVRIYGEDPDVLSTKAAEVQTALAEVSGASGFRLEPTPEESTIEIQVDLERAREHGLKPGDVRRAAASLLGGITVGNVFEEQKVFDVVVWADPAKRDSVPEIEGLVIDAPSGAGVRLGDVARVSTVQNEAVISHESVTRFVELTADVSGRDVGEVNREVGDLLDGIDFPLDHHAEVMVDYRERQAEQSLLIAIVIAAALAAFLLLQAGFRSWRLAALVFLALPAALSGAAVAVLVTGGEVGLGTVAGFLAVLGLAARALVGLVRHLLHLQRHEAMGVLDAPLVIRGTGERLAPTLLSGLAAVVVLLPFVVLGAGTGLEFLHPAAIAVLGGVVTTLVITFLVVPVLYLWLRGEDRSEDWADDLMAPAPQPERI